MQLVGQPCVLCLRPIASIADASFCPSCTWPVHHRCIKARTRQLGDCPTCHADSQSVTEHQKRLHEVLSTAIMDVRNYHRVTGMSRIVAGILCIAAAIPVFLLLHFLVRYFILAILLPAGSALIATGVQQLRLRHTLRAARSRNTTVRDTRA